MAEFTFAPLTPASFLDRAAAVFAGRTAIIDGERRFSYRDMSGRCRRLAGALAALGVGREDRVAALCANSHVMLELHHAVPMAGAALVTLNTRLSEDEMAGLLDHSGSSVLVATGEFADRARQLAGRAGLPCFVAGGPGDSYEDWIAGADEAAPAPVEERQLLAVNYTSGTTGRPKGVMYHHRGAYLQAVAMAYHVRLGPGARYLWTLPMFHCNGWCFTWAVTAAGGTHVCLRAVDTAEIWRLLHTEGITHFSAAPTVLTMIAEDPAAGVLDREVHVDTGGAPPAPALLARMGKMGFAVTHLYGLTETYGPLAINEWQPEWDELEREEQAALRARQGAPNIIARPLRVLDDDGRDVPADGQTIGEIAVAGNDVMLGYYRDEEATAEVTRAGCFLTGDLAVMHPDGYVEIRDRNKDIIISGGENIASVEVEQVLDSHPSVVESAVVGMPDERWGEVPVAFVTLRKDDVDSGALAEYARERLARYKVPRRFEFGELPKTSTGKIQKNVLRDRAGELPQGS
ncbi:MAG: AMP-binding protein [Actinobacteria bacterium]|nr:AMP-binding protein [Actinomycetota bacterium]